MHKIKCIVCEEIFTGHKNSLFCSQDCKNKNRRKKRDINCKEIKRKKLNSWRSIGNFLFFLIFFLL